MPFDTGKAISGIKNKPLSQTRDGGFLLACKRCYICACVILGKSAGRHTGIIIGDRRQYKTVIRSCARQRYKIALFLFHIKLNTKQYNVVTWYSTKLFLAYIPCLCFCLFRFIHFTLLWMSFDIVMFMPPRVPAKQNAKLSSKKPWQLEWIKAGFGE